MSQQNQDRKVKPRDADQGLAIGERQARPGARPAARSSDAWGESHAPASPLDWLAEQHLALILISAFVLALLIIVWLLSPSG